MSFGAMAAWQALLLVAAAGGAAAWLFFVKVRPPRVSVPSLLLWRRVLDHSRELTWWERVRRAVSLAATILIAVALALALTRPGPGTSRAQGGGRVLIVIDSSWSMAAHTAAGPTRWARALAEAHQIAASAASGEVALATTADGIVEAPTSDLALIDTAIDALTPAGGEAGDFPRIAGISNVHFITDGAVARPLDPAISVHSVFDAVPNVAVTALELRPATMPGAAGEAYVEIANYAAAAQSVRLVLSRGTASILDANVDMNAGEVARRSVPLDVDGDAELHVRVSGPSNRLSEDDEAVAWIGGAAPILVALVSDQPGALGAVLKASPGFRTAIVSPSAYRPGREDVAIFDRWVPASAPARPALCLVPPAAVWLGAPGKDETAPRWTVAFDHPVLTGVDPSTFDLKRARAFSGDGLDPIARSEAGTPLVAVSDREDRRLAVIGFSTADANLASAASFPILIDNAIEWLARPVTEASRHPGPIVLPAGTTRVTSPAHQTVALGRVGASTIARLTQPGFYTVDAGGAHATVGVNIGSPEVSNLLRTSLQPDKVATAGASASGHAWWLYAVVAALLLLTAEWCTWQRRLTV